MKTMNPEIMRGYQTATAWNSKTGNIAWKAKRKVLSKGNKRKDEKREDRMRGHE